MNRSPGYQVCLAKTLKGLHVRPLPRASLHAAQRRVDVAAVEERQAPQERAAHRGDAEVVERREFTDFHDVVVWRQHAEFAGKFLAKGRLVYVQGRLHGPAAGSLSVEASAPAEAGPPPEIEPAGKEDPSRRGQ